MAGPLQQAGAISDPSRFAALSMAGEEFTGMWTQAGPYRDAASAYLTRKFYSGSRFDRIIDGVNREITAKLTDGRRPGTITFNSNPMSAVQFFYSFKWIQNGVEVVKVLADTAAGVYDISNNQTPFLIYAKPAGAGRTRFVNIGPILYMGNGVTQKKWVQSAYGWLPTSSAFSDGTKYIVDTNGNIQKSIQTQTVNISQIRVTNGPLTLRTATLFLDPKTPLNTPGQVQLTLSGLTTRPLLNGTSNTWAVDSSLQIHSIVGITIAFTSVTAETGTASTGNGITGNVVPTWATTVGAVTVDAGQQWVCMGPAIQNWGGDAPTQTIAVTQAPFPSTVPAWQASTFYAPLFVIQNAGVYYQLTTDGTTGGGAPAFDPVLGHTTNDGTAVWTSLGAAAWAPSTGYIIGAVVQNTYSYSVTYTTYQYDYATHTVVPTTVTQVITVTSLFVCTVNGTSGASAPQWNNGVGTTTNDNTVAWQNMGSQIPVWTDIGATQKVAKETQVVGSGWLQNVQQFGKTGAAAPTWSTTLGGSTPDNGYLYMWKNTGAIAPGTPAGSWEYAFSGKNTITGEITTASPVSAAINVAVGNAPILTASGLADTQFDQLVIWRTTQGLSTLIQLDTIPNPGAAGTWIYTDTKTDVQLNAFIAAPIDDANDPPPTGATAPTFYLSRLWIIKDNFIQYSQTPGGTVGSAYSAFNPSNYLSVQAKLIRLLPINVQGGALLVFTSSGIFIVLGTGTATDPFFIKQFAEKINLLSYESLDVLGTQIFMMESNFKVSSLTIEYPFNPQSGYTEIGYPIGDQFLKVTTAVVNGVVSGNLYQQGNCYLSWNPNCTSDTGMYVADGSVGWFRMSMVSPPESGILWSPRAAVLGGTSAVQNVETAPGVFNLLIGGNGSGGGTPVMMRETVTTGISYRDFNPGGSPSPYQSWDVKGVNLLNPTGEVTEVAHIGTKSLAIGKRPVVSVLLGEIAPSSTRPYTALDITGNDPALTPKSKSVYSDQYDLMQNGVAVQSDTILTMFDYGSQAFGDELLEWGIFASTENEKKEEAQAAR